MYLVLEFPGILLCYDKPPDVTVARHSSITLGEICVERRHNSQSHCSARQRNDFGESSNTQKERETSIHAG